MLVNIAEMITNQPVMKFQMPNQMEDLVNDRYEKVCMKHGLTKEIANKLLTTY